jgi:putative ABC transport system permease protein
MGVWKEITAVTELNLRSLPQRLGTSLVVVVGIAGVVAVLISVLSLATGLRKTLSSTGRAERVIILFSGAQSEVESNISRDAVLTIKNLRGIRKASDGEAMVSADAVASIWLPKRDGKLGSLAFRGVTAESFAVRPEINLLQGRAFRPGVRELWVGKTAQLRFKGLEIGSRVTSGDAEWLVVGVFASGGDAHESELLADADTLLSAFRRTPFNSITVWLDSPSAFETLKASVRSNPTLVLDVRHEGEYYEQQSKRFATFLAVVANTIGVIMAAGAIFGALNTMHSAVSARTVEIATLRALGYGPWGVVASVFVEGLLLAIAGAVAGAALAWLLFNGRSVSTIAGGSSLTQVAFNLRIGFDLIAVGIVWACTVGLLGGLFPPIYAARAPVAAALRGT